MARIVIFAVFSLLLAGGCKNVKGNDGEPIVSPTNITNEVQSGDDPVLPPYTPWWAKGAK